MTRTATTGQAEDFAAPGTHAVTREQRCGARKGPGKAWQSGDLHRWLQALQQEYDEQVSTVSPCDSTHTIINICRLIY